LGCGFWTAIDLSQNIVLSDKPPITSTIRSLPPQLLENLLTELSTLASVYQKPPEAFLGQGRFGAEAMQRAAIEEQQEEARENPIAAAAAAAAASGQAPTNVENLLDIDFDGSAPASLQKQPTHGASGLEGLAGTPQRVSSPVPNAPQSQSNMDDLLGLFGDGGGGGGGAPAPAAQMSNDDIMNGFASMSMETNQPPPPTQQIAGGEQGKKSNQDLLDLF
jgi:AP-1 complex subunit beta-1